jgi:hypothetical protein
MKLSHEQFSVDFHGYYRCKCGQAWHVTCGCRRRRPGDDSSGLRYFTKYEPTDAKSIDEFRAAVAKDVATL